MKPGPLKQAVAQRSYLLVGALALVLGMGCFEDPVEETLALEFGPRGDLRIESTIQLHWGLSNEDAFQKRLRDVEQELFDGLHPAILRLEQVPELRSDGGEWSRQGGRLQTYRRFIEPEIPSTATTIFGDLPLRPVLEIGKVFAELSLATDGGDRASATQRRRFKTLLADWSAAWARYQQELGKLYEFLEDNPDRARPYLQIFFTAILPDDEEPELGPLAEEVLEPFAEAADAVLSLFEIAAGDDMTLQELSRLLYDPFPGTFEVVVQGTLLEAIGFEEISPNRFVAPRVSLWQALLSSSRRSTAPDPLLVRTEHLRAHEDEVFDFEAFLAQPRVILPSPSAPEARREIESELRGPDYLKLAWELPVTN